MIVVTKTSDETDSPYYPSVTLQRPALSSLLSDWRLVGLGRHLQYQIVSSVLSIPANRLSPVFTSIIQHFGRFLRIKSPPPSPRSCSSLPAPSEDAYHATRSLGHQDSRLVLLIAHSCHPLSHIFYFCTYHYVRA